MRKRAWSVGVAVGLAASAGMAQPDPIQVSFLWHMHQPRYVPGETIFGADAYFSFSVIDVHNERLGPYRSWPKDAIDIGSGMPHLGAQVSFSGSLIENLNELAAAGVNGGQWTNWFGDYRAAQFNTTALGSRRLELVAFGYHHPLLPLLDERDARLQIQLHKHVYGPTWATAYSRGMFPPETAFSTRIIPWLVAEGIDWVMVDNIHFDRASQGYPHTDATGIARPNRADQINPDPAANGGRWVQLQSLWAPSRVSVPFGYQPHWAEYVDPATGQASRIIAVPAARYEGNEDGRGGYGAFLYDQVMDAYLPDNNAADRPMLVLLHHDGDNFGGGSEAYYHGNFQQMVNWASADPDYDVTTVADYLARFPVPTDALIHVEDGSWAGADAGDPEFKKWLGGDVSAGGVSPDLNSWAALIAAKNHVFTLDDQMNGQVNLSNIRNGTGPALDRAWHFLLTAEASDYWYWDGTEVWDSNVTLGSNLATQQADAALASMSFLDTTPPTLLTPQREPYNPGGIEFGSTVQPRDFEVWTLVHDYSGLSSVTLKWRVDLDGENPLATTENETYAGGAGVGAWNSVPMAGVAVPTPANVLPATHKAQRFGAMITGQRSVLIDYYIEAVDGEGNLQRSDIRHVWVGDGTPGGGNGGVSVVPDPPIAGGVVTVLYDASGGPLGNAGTIFAHVGFDDWATVLSPDPAMSDADQDGVWELSLTLPSSATQLDLVFNDGAGTWDNNAGQDWHFAVEGGSGGGFVVDGALDAGATLAGARNGLSLWAGIDGGTLYLATNPAAADRDRFLVVAGTPGALGPAMWAKAGSVAQWDAFVGNESGNNWAGWFDQQGATQVASGAVLEASIDLIGELGSRPDSVFVAVLSYGTNDGGSLDASLQLPAGNGDGSVQSIEYLELRLCELDDSCCPADLTGSSDPNDASFGVPDGDVDGDDFFYFLDSFNAGTLGVCDLTGSSDPNDASFDVPDGDCDGDDFFRYLDFFAGGCG
ncbi:MAG: GC-type dockerin domain-anchored protein [Phycisphaerales bacterium JB037]